MYSVRVPVHTVDKVYTRRVLALSHTGFVAFSSLFLSFSLSIFLNVSVRVHVCACLDDCSPVLSFFVSFLIFLFSLSPLSRFLLGRGVAEDRLTRRWRPRHRQSLE